MLPPDPLSLQTALLLVEIAAIAACAMSGLMEAAHKKLDVVGALAVAGLAAFGGGTLRDVLLDRRPFFWVEHSGYVWFLLGLGLITMLWMRRRHVRPTRRAIVWPDTLGLGLFTATGTQLGLQHGMPPLIAVLMGVITAVMGGVLRDIVCNEIPSAFRDHRPYALCAFAGGWALVGARSLGADEAQALAAAAGLTIALRSAALWTRWRVPAWPAD